MYLTKIPKLVQLYYPDAIWSSEADSSLLLSFDDGPHPDSTPILLDLLKRQKRSATFFCRGSQAKKYPELISAIVQSGHSLGYHGYNHLNGWKTETSTYLEDLQSCLAYYPSQLFRPAYGKITKNQYAIIKKQLNLDIVFWTHMPGDFDSRVSSDLLTTRIRKADKAGNIIVLHDKPECLSKVCTALSNN